MSDRLQDSLKTIATELSQLLLAEDPSQETIRRLQAGLSHPEIPKPEKDPHNGTANNGKPGPFGIWKPVERNGGWSFLRDPAKRAEWPLWANVHEIRPKGRRKRIVLLGESVARGYFFDPYYSVAMELDGILGTCKALGETEIIDLARTSMDMAGLMGMIKACTILEPDAVLIFAGNNWRTDNGSSAGDLLKTVFDIYAKEGYPGVKLFAEDRLKNRTMSVLKEIQCSLVALGVPTIFVVPEFNLKDWRSSEAEQILPRLPGDGISRWLAVKDIALAALAENRIRDAESPALEMTSLDPSNPLGHELLGQVYIAMGQWEKARECFESARDTALLNREDSKPRCFKVIRDTITAEAGRYGISVVDLAAVFEAEYGGLPGRDIFMDYCHLTVKGIKTAMHHVARTLIQAMTMSPVSAEDIGESGLEPGAKVQATAHFCAAIHNAHAGQGFETLRYHCSRAISLSVDLKKMMTKFIDFSTRQASTLLCRSFEELIVDEDVRQYEGGLALANPRLQKLMDISLVDCMVKFGKTPPEEVNNLRLQEHAVRGEAKDLLESYYSSTFYHGHIISPRPLFLQARTTVTRFHFIAGGETVSLEMVYRTPGGMDKSRLITIINLFDGVTVAEVPMSVNWAKCKFQINGDSLLKGVNVLTIHWPYLVRQEINVNRRCTHSLFNGIFPAIGEVHSLTMTGMTNRSYGSENWKSRLNTLFLM